MKAMEYREEIGILIVSVLCALGGMFGTRLKYHALKDAKKIAEFDRERFLSGLFLSSGAGVVTALLGEGLHINRAFLIGASIVAGYAGGRKFFEWLQKMLAAFTARRLLDKAKEGGETMAKMLDGDEDKDGDDPP